MTTTSISEAVGYDDIHSGALVISDSTSDTSGSILQREHVCERFRLASVAPVTLVVAGAGYGKSTALKAHLHGVKERVVSVRLLECHSDLPSVASALATALSAPRRGLPPEAAYAGGAASFAAEWLLANIGVERTVIAFDDFQHGASSTDVIRFLEQCVVRSPATLRWIFVGRSMGSLPVARWIADDTVRDLIDEDVLRFRHSDLCALAGQLDIPEPASARGVCDATNGWPIAVNFALKRSRRGAEPGAVDLSYLQSYFAEQVFRELDPDIQKFLLATCPLRRLDPQILREMPIGEPSSIIRRLSEVSIIVAPDADGVFRVHDLIRTFLIDRLRAYKADQYASVYLAAATALEKNGRLEEALFTYVELGNSSHLIDYLGRAAIRLLDEGAFGALRLAIDALPHEIAGETPVVLLIEGLLCSDNPVEARRLLDRALTLNSTDGMKQQIVLRRIQLLYLYFANEFEGELLGLHGTNWTDADLEVSYLGHLAVAHACHCRTDEMKAAISRALSRTSRCASPATVAILYLRVAIANSVTGEFSECTKWCRESQQIAEREGLLATYARTVYSEYINELDYAERYPVMRSLRERFDQVARRSGDPKLVNQADLLRWRSAIEAGDDETCHAFDVRFDRGDFKHNAGGAVLAGILGVEAGMRGDYRAAFSRLMEFPAPFDRECITGASFAHYAGRAFFAAAAGLRDDALVHCDDAERVLRQLPELALSRPRHLNSGVDLVVALIILGKQQSALKHLITLERLSEHCSSARGAAVVRVARSLFVAAEVGIENSDLAESLAALADQGLAGYGRMLADVPLPQSTAVSSVASLTRAELGVLRMMGEGLGSIAIAEHLGRSVQTIRTQEARIRQKLGRSKRSQVIAFARERGLIR